MSTPNRFGLSERSVVGCVVLFYMITALVMVSVNKVPFLFGKTRKVADNTRTLAWSWRRKSRGLNKGHKAGAMDKLL
jgi:hypothetical protein